MDSSSRSLPFYDFLDRMRHPASVDLVRSIKSFIVSFSFHAVNSENDGKRLQDFLSTMETSIRDHPLWSGASEEEIDCAIEGLEKYVMTKLYARTFASSQEDAKVDQEISEKIHLLQKFVRPKHLDIPEALHNEASWLLAEKELQKMNAFKVPREKLLCILSCCRVISNLLLNVSMSENHVLAGADDFLPVLIYVTIKANPPQLHSNLKFIQLFRRQSKLISEVAYYFTNLMSVKSFIIDLDGKSLSIDESEFQEKMLAARLEFQMNMLPERLAKGRTQIDLCPRQVTAKPTDHGFFSRKLCQEISTLDGGDYPFMETVPEDLTVGDVERLHSLYKDVVKKYSSLCRSVRSLTLSKEPSVLPHLGDVKHHQPDQPEHQHPEGQQEHQHHQPEHQQQQTPDA
ncbi:vacuolar protein sorting-associated protein 9A-like [Telopea speciosissima]|uniref:vacuolar protein sorting-associated protein 9A-like n=1 Tax=Telopea speciosissima TaxID=54955 RepID=UPI001CC5BD2B|nr:vacuolar protein sorting-associated protein 9A-like [Telopea speciosissima]